MELNPKSPQKHRPATEAKRTGCRRRLFRVAAVMLGLSVFAIAEGVCFVFDWGRPTDYADPFVGFSTIRRLFVLDQSGAQSEIPQSRRNFFAAESFPASKEKNTFRVFCLGGSTVQGRPFSKETSFTIWLELSLKAADDSRDWEVVNCGGISYASYRLVPILQECLAYEPNLFILCTGHNEFLEEREYEHVKYASSVVKRPLEALSQFRSFTLYREALFQATGKTSNPDVTNQRVMKAEVDALLDYRGGLQLYHRDEQWKAEVMRHFEHNLRHMIAIARDAGVPLMMIRPPSNLCDCPPFKSQHRDGLTPAKIREWEVLIEQAKRHYRSDLQRAIQLLKQAIEIDEEFAFTFYELGKCYETLGLREQARDVFSRAKELDVCPLRILQPMEHVMAEVAEATSTPLIDAHELLERNCPKGILGDSLLVDHIHPTFRGHQMIANALTEEMARRRWVKPADDWQAKRSRAYQSHFDSIETIYFLHGLETVKALRKWTRGRVDGPP